MKSEIPKILIQINTKNLYNIIVLHFLLYRIGNLYTWQLTKIATKRQFFAGKDYFWES